MGIIHTKAFSTSNFTPRQQSIAHITQNPHSLFPAGWSRVSNCIGATWNGTFVPPTILAWTLCHIIKCEKGATLEYAMCDQKIICYQVRLRIKHFDQGIEQRKWLFLRVPHLDTISFNIDNNKDEMVAAITKPQLTNNRNYKKQA